MSTDLSLWLTVTAWGAIALVVGSWLIATARAVLDDALRTDTRDDWTRNPLGEEEHGEDEREEWTENR